VTQAAKKASRSLSKWLAVTVVGLCVLTLFLVQKISYLSAAPGKDKECEPLYPNNISDKSTTMALTETPFMWLQKGGVINDASCVDQTSVYGVVAIESEKDIADALQFAQSSDLKASIAGVKHSMGGHAFAKGNLVLDMTRFNAIQINEERKTMTVQSGATWHDIQTKIHPRYAVSAMQSTDIFTVGGSISVNAHGMDHTVGAIENSIVSLRVMLPDGTIKRLSRAENTELYNLVVGGYGLFGVILDAELRLADNDLYESSRKIISYKDFPEFFKTQVQSDPNVGLTYTHLSTVPNSSFLDEGIVYLYTKSEDAVPIEDIPPLGEVSSVSLRRFVMNLSKYGGLFQAMRWWSEKYIEPKMESCSISRNQAQSSGEACLVARNEPMHDSVPYLKNSLKKETDILHEYFIPRDNLVAFIDGMREIIIENGTNLLNASIRVVNKERGMLTYAPEEAFSVVLYINQKTDVAGHAAMKKVTSELIDLAVKYKGRFFLPYQLHYTQEQLHESYPNIDQFFALKRVYDPEEILTNTWYEKYGKTI
jgi:FAD/FMN-containing dehydrogenase